MKALRTQFAGERTVKFKREICANSKGGCHPRTKSESLFNLNQDEAQRRRRAVTNNSSGS